MALGPLRIHRLYPGHGVLLRHYGLIPVRQCKSLRTCKQYRSIRFLPPQQPA